MTNLKKLVMKAAIATSLVALVAGCSGGNSNVADVAEQPSETISGVPVSVAGSSGDNGDKFSVVIYKDNEFTLGENYSSIWNTTSVALVQSEINDGDNEEIELTGNYGTDDDGNKILSIQQMKVQGYTMNY